MKKTTLFISLVLCLCCISGLAQRKMSTQEYIETYSQIAVKNMKSHGIPASITLAQGILESGNGGGRLAIEANNHFGIKCKSTWTGDKIYHNDDAMGECFRKYETPEESYLDHSIFLTSAQRYSSLFTLQLTDYRGWAFGLKAAGYATNPRYAELLIGIIEKNELHRFDSTKILNFITTQDTPKDGPAKKLDKKGRKWGRNNGLRYVVSMPGDTFGKVARQSGLTKAELLKFNDLKGVKVELTEGMALYTERKNRTASPQYSLHSVVSGDSAHSIAQKYGMRLKSLHRLNPSLKRSAPKIGQILKLR